MSSNPEGWRQLETMVKRYRNSPSIIMWSIGNEEWQLQDAMAEQGAKIGSHGRGATNSTRRALSPRPSTGDNEKGVSDAFDIIGFNYNLKLTRRVSQEVSGAPLYGSETSSAVHARRLRHRPLRNTVNAYDGVVPWGETPKSGGSFYATRDWEAGGFAWTGFDYRGEPTPYGWPSINSQFGIVDMCGFPRTLLLLQGVVGQEPSLHLFPHWNSRAGRRHRSPCGSTRIWTRSSCSSTARARAARRSRIWAMWSGR
jgi:beta-galactosidase